MDEDYFATDQRTNRERMLAGDWYIADDPENSARHDKAIHLTHLFAQEYAQLNPLAQNYLAELFHQIGPDTQLLPPVRVDYGENISIGARCFINFNLTALDVAPITIGDDCQIGPNVQLLTPIHPLSPEERRAKLEAARPIVIEDNVWLGGGVIVCPGVRIGENSVIGAGSVVTRDIPANVVAVGNPARVIKQL